MNCREAQRHLHDYVDSELAPDFAAEVDGHLGTCEACEERERKLRELVEGAAALSEWVEPPRDLWPGIEERLDATDRDAPIPFPRRSTPMPKWGYGLLAASLLIAVVAGVYLGRDSAPLVTKAPGSPDLPTEIASLPGGAGPENLLAAEASIVEAKQDLRVAFEARRDSLDPETAATVDRNLKLIDDAIVEIHAALENEPENPELNKMLMAAHQRGLYVLQRAMQLAARL